VAHFLFVTANTLQQMYATNLNISVSRGSAATYFRCGGQCYMSFFWCSCERIWKIC